MATIIGLIIFVGLIFFLNAIAEKRPTKPEEINSIITNTFSLLNSNYDFDRNINFQSATNFSRNGWYVSDCVEYFHVIAFDKDNNAKLSTASKEALKTWNYESYMQDVRRRLNEKNDWGKTNFIYKKNELEIRFPNTTDNNLLFRCKIKNNGILVVRRYYTDSKTNKIVQKENQYVFQRRYSLGYDLHLHKWLDIS